MKSIVSITCSIILIFWAFQPVSAAEKQDFDVKAFHIDLRCEVMTMPALMSLAKDLSGMGINTIIMEWEGTFPYDRNATLSNKYAYTREEVKSFISYCSTLGIDVIPLQNCFGHVEYILRHDRYAGIKEDSKEISQVCPSKEDKCKAVFTDIFSEVAELHPSKYFFIGGDETFLLGSCKLCAAKVASEGKSKLFVDYVKVMCGIVKSMGKIPILWADILLKYPEAASELPKDAIFVDWNYGKKFADTSNLLKLGLTVWGAPSLRSAPDNLYLTQWEKHFNNINTFIPYSRKSGYKGIIMTSWSTSGTYGFTYDNGFEVISMHPIRNVYPLSGFRILEAAYAEALKTDKPLIAGDFVISYTQRRFGLTLSESELLWQILKAPQNLVKSGKDTNSSAILEIKDDAVKLQKQLSTLKPKANRNEFDHLRIMLDIRVQYLVFKELEARYQSPEFSRSLAKSILKELEVLIVESNKTDMQFNELNNGFLKSEELIELTKMRNEKLQNMYLTLKSLSY